MTGPGHGKRMHQVATRVDEETLDEIDRYQRDVEQRTGRPRTRSLTILDLLIEFAARRRAEREAARTAPDLTSEPTAVRARVDRAS